MSASASRTLRRLYETVRRLRASQPAHRLARRGRVALGVPAPAARSAWAGILPLPPLSRRPLVAPFDAPLGPDGTAWTFAGRVGRLHADGSVALDGEPSDLQRHHLRYAEVVRACAEGGRPDLAARWLDGILAATPAPVHPYVRSRRILALVEAAAHGLDAARAVVVADAQALARDVEHDVGGNHLLANATALHRAGLASSGPAASALAARGSALLASCVRTQVLADGVHEERSPVYQSLVLEHLLTALESAAARGVAPPPGVEDAARRLSTALAELVLPDGEPLRRGDGAPGVALPVPALLAWSERRAGPSRAARRGTRILSAAGIAVSEDVPTRTAVSLLACPCAPRDLPAHGHADALAVEVVLGGRRVIASSGTAAYGRGPERDADRSPGAFAGVLVDGRAPADPYDAFRIGARGWVRRLEAWPGEGATSIQAFGDGHATTSDRVVHRRVVAALDGAVAIVDEWTGRATGTIDLLWPFAPGIRISPDGHGAAFTGADVVGRWWAAGGETFLEPGRFATGMGLLRPRSVLRHRLRGARPTRCLTLLALGTERLSGAVVPVSGAELRVEVVRGDVRRAFHVQTGRSP